MKLNRTFGWMVLSVLLSYATNATARSGSLQCEQASTSVELMICDEKRNPDLYALDIQLNMFFGEARAHVAPEGVSGLASAQKKWLKEVRNACGNPECVRRVYQQRVRELQEMSTLCAASEVVVYSCVLSARKVVSLCASSNANANTGYLQFRLGRDRSDLDMEFPQEKTPAKENFKYYRKYSDPKLGVSFWSGDTRWSVVETKGGRGVYQHYGIVIDKGRPPIFDSFMKCKREPVNFYEFQEYSSINIWTLTKSLFLPDANEDIRFLDAER